jgi:hypothetical protein
MRPFLLGLTLSLAGSGAAWAQDACADKCTSSLPPCISKCEGAQRCSSNCTNQLSACMTRCNQKPQKSASKSKKCLGANGKSMPCPDYREPKTKTRVEPEEEYPNKGAIDLAKDPNFKVEP